MSASPSVDDRPARLSVGVVGAGRVGVVLAAALAQAGHQVVAVSAVRTRPAAGSTSCCPVRRSLAPPQVLAAAELVLLTVPDDVLPGLVEGLAAAGAIAARPARSCTPAAGTASPCSTRRPGRARCRWRCTRR